MIEFRNVNKVYSTGTEALHNANFTIDKGEFAFLVGSSGSRKIYINKINFKGRRTNIRKYHYKWQRYYFSKEKQSSIFT
jgi:ABC-type ATPase involved in cell division